MSVTTTRARVDKLLTDVSRRHNVEGLIADEVLTKVTVEKQTGLIGKYGNEHLRIVHDLVGGMTKYPEITVDTKNSDRYVLEKHGLKTTISEEEINNEELPFDARKDATIDVTDRLLLGREYALSSILTSTSVLTNNTTLSGTDQFNDYDNSKPLEVFRAARESIYAKTGKDTEMAGGFAIVPWDVMNALCYHPDLLDLYKYVSSVGNGLSREQLKSAMKVDRILVALSQYDTSKEGQTASIAPTWGKDIVFGYAPRTGSKRIQSLGFNVRQTGADVRTFVKSIDDPPNSEMILVDHMYDDLITDTGAGYLIKDAVA